MRYIKISGEQFADKLEQIRLGNLILKILIQNYLQEIFPENKHLPNLRWKLRNSSHWFESGFSGFSGFMITSPA